MSVIDVRGMNFINITIKVHGRGPWRTPTATVVVGAGATAGQAQYVSYVETNHAAKDTKYELAGVLGVGQKPSVGMSGLTLGGGFGFITRYAGLLCDQLKALTAILPTTGKAERVTAHNKYADLFWASCGGGGGNVS